MALINIDIEDYLHEADTECIIDELKRRKVKILDFFSQMDDSELIELISSQKNLSIIQTDQLIQTFKNL